MQDRTFHIKSFGCQMNKLDTGLVASSLRGAGLRPTGSVKEADVVVINTCSVRQHAEERVLSHLGHLKHLKQHRPAMVVAVIGCMAQRLGAKLLEHPAVDIVCGPAQIPQIADLVRQALDDSTRSPDAQRPSGPRADRAKRVAVTEQIRQLPQEGDGALDRFELAYSGGRSGPGGQRSHRPQSPRCPPAPPDAGHVAAPCDPAPLRGPQEGSDAGPPGQAFVRVMRGCNYFCTYCIVPYVRGPEACRAPEAILEQVRRLAGEGVRQVTLLGQTVNSYKYRTGGRTWCLADLLDSVSQVDGIEWIKFVTSYPADEFYEQILQVMAAGPRVAGILPAIRGQDALGTCVRGPETSGASGPQRRCASGKVCRYLHLPAQSGSDRILRAMNRHYTAAHYLELIEKARAIVPDIALAGDFIVGFPGESEEDFQATAELVRRARYKNCFVFKYSPRPGTTADRRLADTVPDQVKQRRNAELLAIQEQASAELNETLLGSEVTVLVEGLSKRQRIEDGEYKTEDRGECQFPSAVIHPQLVGRTSGDQIVVFNGPAALAGRFAQVRITRTSPLTLFGELAAEMQI